MAVLTLFFTASCDYLDVVPNDIPTLDHAFEDKAQAEKYLYTCYGYLPEYMSPAKDPAIMGSGEFLSYTTGNGAVSLYNLALITGGQNISAPICNNWETDTWYYSPYQAIRVCNTFLEKIDEPFDLDNITKTRWVAEVKFLKAYYNYCLIRMYGPIVIQDTNHDVNAEPDAVREYRTPFDECIDYVVALLDEATPDLPLRIEKETEELGRATQAIAKAVKAKVLVMAASPLFNGNPLYANIVDGRGVRLFPEAGEKAEKWKRAEAALKDAIETAELAGNDLYTLRTHAYSLNQELEKQLEIRYKIWDAWNTETVWGYTRTSTFALQYNSMPRLTADALKNSYVKGGSLALHRSWLISTTPRTGFRWQRTRHSTTSIGSISARRTSRRNGKSPPLWTQPPENLLSRPGCTSTVSHVSTRRWDLTRPFGGATASMTSQSMTNFTNWPPSSRSFRDRHGLRYIQ